ncbi:septum formation initiator family protein [Ochrobactrum oryzae]|uniref:Cell division protein n=1 Tax=Brucella oryzae TaxID=335286 RepID=A0A2S7IY14_9HYPH|nr:septum formation initiator family protein [Brucella oryzae]MBR7652797.1 septum formation initiator family protein [Brucella oryzae]NKC22171.1 septum formation initiator family protein [Brucella oryzae]PQA72894.1 cell division protein [Brucella oryzae]
MWTKQKRKSIRGRFVLPILTAAFLSYFGFHAYHGEFGLYSRIQLEEQKSLLTKQLEQVTADRTALEKRVALLRDGSIEKDMLDEQARRALNLSHPDEVTIITSREDRSN